ncbi:MAG: ROK family protein [Bacteroidota bacterium]
MNQLRFSRATEKSRTSRENRQSKQLQKIVSNISKSEEALTIPEISSLVKISIPTGTKLVRQLVEEGLVVEGGKKETENGRRPSVYTLNNSKFYALGVEVLKKWIHVSIVRVDMETIYESSSREFRLEDTAHCLEQIIQFILNTIQESPARTDQIIGAGIALTGSVNGHTGQSADYFSGLNLHLVKYFEQELNLQVAIDNDTRVIGIAEQVLGVAKGVENVLVVKVSRDLGLSIILDKNIIFGAAGFAGNFGHIQFGGKGRLCTCGKKGCLRTEVSGDALKQDLQEALASGERSIYFNQMQIDNYRYHDVLDAVLKGDALSIQLLHQQGMKLGRALGNVANLLNPNLIVIGGEYVMVKDFFLDAVRIGMKETALVSVMKNCQVRASKLDRYFSSRGAACMVLKNCELISY